MRRQARVVTAAPGPLPLEVTTYVGRRAETAELRRLLASASVVTLTGPGGVGKTRLATRTAACAAGDFDNGAVFVPLAELHDGALLPTMVADALGLSDRSGRPTLELLVSALQNRAALLVLDNCEHLVDACAALVDTLVQSCPRLVVLATSRQSLGVQGEQILPVDPLSIPDPSVPTDRLLGYDAVQMFVDRARAVVPEFEITNDNADAIVELCHRLDGLPLAIELAAVRLRALSVQQLTERLDQRFTLLGSNGRRLGPTRHETLQRLIDWSYELCSETERLLWSRLAVFSGNIYLDAAEAVCGVDGLATDEVVDVLDGLIDKSILRRVERDGSVGYRMLETVREYGQDRLRAADDLGRWQRRHRDYYVELTNRFAGAWLGPDQADWARRLDREHSNVRLALDFCAREPEEAVTGIEIAYAVKEYWVLRGFNTEARLQTSRLLDVASPTAPNRALLLWYDAFLAVLQGDDEGYERARSEAWDVVTASGDEHAAAYVLNVEGYRALISNDMAVAAELFARGSEGLRAAGDLAGALWATYNYGIAVALSGHLEQGRDILRRSIDEYAARGEWFWRCWALWSLGASEYVAGDLGAARTACEEVLRHQSVLHDRAILAFTLTLLSGVEAKTAHDRRAARLYGAAATVWASLGTSPRHYGAFVPELERDSADVKARLGAQTAAEEFTAGAAMPVDDAIDYALCAPSTDHGGPPDDSPLTNREQQVAELVSQGLSNREIAKTLVIAQRTAESHVEHILSKLGFNNRAQVTRWVIERRVGLPHPGRNNGSQFG